MTTIFKDILNPKGGCLSEMPLNKSGFIEHGLSSQGLPLIITVVFFTLLGQSIPAAAAQISLNKYLSVTKNIPASPVEGKSAGYSIAVDINGNVYVAGKSNVNWGAPVRPLSGGANDAFVAKLNNQGELQWNTFLGGDLDDGCSAIGLDDKGYIYVTGESGTTWGAPLRGFGGGSSDGFVAKLDSNGVLQWNTFLGGSLYDGGNALAVTKKGNVYVAGNSVETWGSPVNLHTGTGHDGFVAQLDENGVLLWNTFVGGDGYDGGDAIALDNSGNVYVTGESINEWGSPVNNFVQGDFGNDDAFVVKLDQNGILLWNTFLGGIGSDFSRGVAVDMQGKIYIAGSSNISWGHPLLEHNGDFDAFIAVLDEHGALLWNTFLGGKGPDSGRAISVNWTGNIFLTGQSSSSWGSPSSNFSGESDAFAAKLDNNGMLKWNIFLGKAGFDFGRSVSTDEIENVYLAGESYSLESPRESVKGKVKAFAVKLNNEGIFRWSTFFGGG